MPSEIFAKFEEMCSQFDMSGSILEIGCGPSMESLIFLPCVAKNAKFRVGVNLFEKQYKDFKIIECNANDMSEIFPHWFFDVVLCNAIFEHDKYFWKSLAEVRRVLKPGGMFFLGVPAFVHDDGVKGIPESTVTYRLHSEPCDYYRFSRYAYEQVLMEDFTDVHCESIMAPPRLVGYGRHIG